MVFWLAILVGALFVWLAVRLGFYETWNLFFGVVISIYMAIYLAPSVIACAPAVEEVAAYCTALSMTVVAGGCFALLYGLSYIFLTAQFNVSFPKVFDILLAGALGFLTGFLITSFVALIITTTPLAQHKLVSSMGFNPESEETNIGCIAWCCDMVHSVAAPDADEGATEAAIHRLLDEAQDVSPGPGPSGEDVNEPATSVMSLPEAVPE